MFLTTINKLSQKSVNKTRKDNISVALKNSHTSSYHNLQTPIIRLKPLCPCDGGCPRCQNALPLQAKLTFSQSGDKYEQEANRIANEAIQIPDTDVETKPIGRFSIQPIQAKAEDQSIVPYIMDYAVRSSGQPLNAHNRCFMESRFQRDFSQVRIHSNTQAGEAARAINAKAFTLGRNIVFGAGLYQPDSASGKKLIAHELAHVVQQNNDSQKILGIQREQAESHEVSPPLLAGVERISGEFEGTFPFRITFTGIPVNCGQLLHEQFADGTVRVTTHRPNMPERTDILDCCQVIQENNSSARRFPEGWCDDILPDDSPGPRSVYISQYSTCQNQRQGTTFTWEDAPGIPQNFSENDLISVGFDLRIQHKLWRSGEYTTPIYVISFSLTGEHAIDGTDTRTLTRISG